MTTQDSNRFEDDAEDVTVSVAVRLIPIRPETDSIYWVSNGERILGYIHQRDDGWHWSPPTDGYPFVWTGPFDLSDAAIVGLLTRSAGAAD